MMCYVGLNHHEYSTQTYTLHFWKRYFYAIRRAYNTCIMSFFSSSLVIQNYAAAPATVAAFNIINNTNNSFIQYVSWIWTHIYSFLQTVRYILSFVFYPFLFHPFPSFGNIQNICVLIYQSVIRINGSFQLDRLFSFQFILIFFGYFFHFFFCCCGVGWRSTLTLLYSVVGPKWISGLLPVDPCVRVYEEVNTYYVVSYARFSPSFSFCSIFILCHLSASIWLIHNIYALQLKSSLKQIDKLVQRRAVV